MIDSIKVGNNIEVISFKDTDKFNALIAEEARESMVRFFDTPNAKVIIDLSGIKYIDSSGFGCFLATMKASRNNYGIMKICGLSPDVKKLFTNLQLHTIFELFDDLDSCVKSF
jgi:anti-sigma B factor antagonist